MSHQNGTWSHQMQTLCVLSVFHCVEGAFDAASGGTPKMKNGAPRDEFKHGRGRVWVVPYHSTIWTSWITPHHFIFSGKRRRIKDKKCTFGTFWSPFFMGPVLTIKLGNFEHFGQNVGSKSVECHQNFLREFNWRNNFHLGYNQGFPNLPLRQGG